MNLKLFQHDIVNIREIIYLSLNIYVLCVVMLDRDKDGVKCFPLDSEMWAESSLFWLPRHVCPSEGFALPPTGFGCREQLILSL